MRRFGWSKTYTLMLTLQLFVPLGCGTGSDQESDSQNSTTTPDSVEDPQTILPTTPNLANVSGLISSNSGNVSELNKWKLFMMDTETGNGYLTAVPDSGVYVFQNVNLAKKYPLLLFSPDYQFAATFVAKTQTTQGFLPYFSIINPSLPFLSKNGPLLSFSNNSGVVLENVSVKDDNNDGTPDGLENMWALTEAPNSSSIGLDKDADGIVNRIDRDDDNDNIPDYLDLDSNGNGLDDTLEVTHDQYYTGMIQYITVDLESIPAGASSEYYLRFLVKLNLPVASDKIKVIGPSSIFTTAKSVDQTGASEAWSGELFDDGLHHDLVAKDNIFGVKLKVNQNNLPKQYHTFL